MRPPLSDSPYPTFFDHTAIPCGDTRARLQSLIERMDQAVDECKECEKRTCRAVKEVLEAHIQPEEPFLPIECLRTSGNSYARNLLHRDPRGRYSIIVMVWDQGQGTPIHDHGGLWCVECVYQGRIRVKSFDYKDVPGHDMVRFEQTGQIIAGIGEAGALIPPFDYHTIDNPFDKAAATVHVYGGEMDFCNTFEQQSCGGYLKIGRDLCFDNNN